MKHFTSRNKYKSRVPSMGPQEFGRAKARTTRFKLDRVSMPREVCARRSVPRDSAWLLALCLSEMERDIGTAGSNGAHPTVCREYAMIENEFEAHSHRQCGELSAG